MRRDHDRLVDEMNRGAEKPQASNHPSQEWMQVQSQHWGNSKGWGTGKGCGKPYRIYTDKPSKKK